MLRMTRLSLFSLVVMSLAGAFGGATSVRASDQERPLVETICPLMEKEAQLNGISPALFVRLIWRESGFRPNVVSHKGAQGIAQFMPGTAKERGLDDPFDPALAIPHSARLLADLMKEFGNFGLAAAAYNAGPDRVRGWLEGSRTLPAETRTYVQFITGHAAERWKEAGGTPAEPTAMTSAELQDSCRKRAPALVQVALAGKPKVQAARRPWGVQLGAGPSEAKVAGLFNTLKRQHAKVLADAEPMYVPARIVGRGAQAMVALRVGADTRDDALKLCVRLRSSGGVCTVQKN